MAATRGSSLLPASSASSPAEASSSLSRLQTVVLPFVPVTAITGTGLHAWARSSSPTTGRRCRSAAAYTGWWRGTPGAGATASTSATSRSMAAASGGGPVGGGVGPIVSGHDVDPPAAQRGGDGRAGAAHAVDEHPAQRGDLEGDEHRRHHPPPVTEMKSA